MVMLPLATEEQVSSYVLQLPEGSATRQSLSPGQRELSIAATEMPGNYRVRAGGQKEKLDRGFSVNVSPDLSHLERAAPTKIIKALGENRVRIARTRDEIEVRVGAGRLGRELFPVVILVVALVLAAEQWFANRFYAPAPETSPRSHAPRGNALSSRSASSSLEPTMESAFMK
jgi:hypothetical protein